MAFDGKELIEGGTLNIAGWMDITCWVKRIVGVGGLLLEGFCKDALLTLCLVEFIIIHFSSNDKS